MKKFKCHICGEKKVGLFAKWFGLDHCQDCELKPITEYTEMLRAETKMINRQTEILKNKLVATMLEENTKCQTHQ